MYFIKNIYRIQSPGLFKFSFNIMILRLIPVECGCSSFNFTAIQYSLGEGITLFHSYEQNYHKHSYSCLLVRVCKSLLSIDLRRELLGLGIQPYKVITGCFLIHL